MEKTETTGTAGTKKNQFNSQNNGQANDSKDHLKKGNVKQKTLEDLFKDGIKNIYKAEKQLVEALPEMAKAADHEELQDAINEHLQQTKRQVERLEKIISRLQIEKQEDEKCEVMESLINAGKKKIDEIEAGPVRDAAIIISSQKIEHHEIAAYGSLCELADVLGYTKIGDILDRTLQEEEETDERLTSIAQEVNDDAYEISCEAEEELETI